MGQACHPSPLQILQAALRIRPLPLARLLPVLMAALMTVVLLGGCSLLDSKVLIGWTRSASRGGKASPCLTATLPRCLSTASAYRIDPAHRVYTGTLDLDFTVSSTLPLAELYFRTYPNLLVSAGSWS